MTRPLCRVLACLTIVPLSFAADVTVSDGVVVTALRQAAPELPAATIVQRIMVDDQLDLVVALASPCASGFPTCRSGAPQSPDGRYWWSTRDRLGLFLQDRSDPGRVDRLAVEPGPNDDCATRIERATSQELVLSCVGEKWATYDNRKFVYDIHAKALVSSFSYPPFRASQVLRDATGTHFLMDNSQQVLGVDINPDMGVPRVAPVGDRTLAPDSVVSFGSGLGFRLAREKNKYGSEYTLIVEGTGTNQKPYPLPQTDLRTWQQARPDDAQNFALPDQAEMNEEIGPHQVEGDRLWFGKTFYNSEGSTGVGGFGYFDAAAARYQLYSPPEIQRWSVSAMLVETDCVWLALYRRGEYGNNSGGLLRWDRVSNGVERFAVTDLVNSIACAGGAIYLGADDGIVALNGDRIVSYFVDRATGCRYEIAERNSLARPAR